MVASSPVGNVPEHLLQTCVAYQHEVALIHRDIPPGDTRETRLAEAMAHGAAVCTSATLEALQRLRTDAPASHQESLQRLRAWALAMHVRSALLPLQRGDPRPSADRSMSGRWGAHSPPRQFCRDGGGDPP